MVYIPYHVAFRKSKRRHLVDIIEELIYLRSGQVGIYTNLPLYTQYEVLAADLRETGRTGMAFWGRIGNGIPIRNTNPKGTMDGIYTIHGALLKLYDNVPH
jgi:hypothetical protein